MKTKFCSAILSILLIMAILSSVPVFAATNVSPISNLRQSYAKSDSVTVTWTNVLTANQYVCVELSVDGNTWESESAFSKESETISGLTSGATYYVRARMNNGNSYSAYTDPIAVTTIPSAVKNIRQTDATTNSITVAWDKSSGATSYKVGRWVNNQEYIDGETTKTSFTIKGLKNTTEFASKIFVKPVRDIGTIKVTPNLEYYWEAGYIDSYSIRLVPKKINKPTVDTVYTAIDSGWFSVNHVPFADGYQYQIFDASNKKVQTGTNTSSSIGIKSIKHTQFYKVRARAYTNIGKKTKYGKWSGYTYYANSVKLNTRYSRNRKTVKLTWHKTKGAKNYTVYVNGRKVKTVKKPRYTVKKKSSLSYPVYVIANKKVGKKTYKSQISSQYI